jgi:hypothetical protein
MLNQQYYDFIDLLYDQSINANFISQEKGNRYSLFHRVYKT